jgi:hypothetical protein
LLCPNREITQEILFFGNYLSNNITSPSTSTTTIKTTKSKNAFSFGAEAAVYL